MCRKGTRIVMREFERVKPGANPRGNGVEVPWAIVLSDWLPAHRLELLKTVEHAARKAPAREQPMILVVVDLDLVAEKCDLKQRQLLTDLTEVGSIVLEPEGEEDMRAARTDPLDFAARQVAMAIQTEPCATTAPATPQPSEPDAYKDFAKAFTELAPDDLKSLIEGQRPNDGWRYDW